VIVPAFSHGLYGRLRQLAAADWQHYGASFRPAACRRHPGGKRFSSLSDQDYLFLIHFARSYALLVSKLRTLPEMRAAAASMNAILNELPLHVGYCAVGD
jgi:thiaminase/transcriptional activator TenA